MFIEGTESVFVRLTTTHHA